MNLFISIMIYNSIAVAILLGILKRNPRYLLQDFPGMIIQAVPAQSPDEKRKAKIWGLPFITNMFATPVILALMTWKGVESSYLQISLYIFILLMSFNLVDLILVDWIIFCTITPHFIIVPGTEDHRGYKDYFFHFRAFLRGCLIMTGTAPFLAGLVLGVRAI